MSNALIPETEGLGTVFQHELIIGPALQFFLDSQALETTLETRRILFVLAVLPNLADFSHEQFGVLFYGHADPASREILEQFQHLQSELRLERLEVRNLSNRWSLRGLQIVRRVPEEDIKIYLSENHIMAHCSLPAVSA